MYVEMTSAIGNAIPITTSNLPYNAESVVAKASPLYGKIFLFLLVCNLLKIKNKLEIQNGNLLSGSIGQLVSKWVKRLAFQFGPIEYLLI